MYAYITRTSRIPLLKVAELAKGTFVPPAHPGGQAKGSRAMPRGPREPASFHRPGHGTEPTAGGHRARPVSSPCGRRAPGRLPSAAAGSREDGGKRGLKEEAQTGEGRGLGAVHGGLPPPPLTERVEKVRDFLDAAGDNLNVLPVRPVLVNLPLHRILLSRHGGRLEEDCLRRRREAPPPGRQCACASSPNPPRGTPGSSGSVMRLRSVTSPPASAPGSHAPENRCRDCGGDMWCACAPPAHARCGR